MSEPPVAAPVIRTSIVQAFLDEAHSNAYKNAADSLARCGQLIQNTSARIAADRQLLTVLEEAHEKLAAVVLTRLKRSSHFFLLLFLLLTQNTSSRRSWSDYTNCHHWFAEWEESGQELDNCSIIFPKYPCLPNIFSLFLSIF